MPANTRRAAMRNWLSSFPHVPSNQPGRGICAQIKSFFISLFIASTGLVMSPVFLALHLPILTAGLILVVISKTVVVRAAVSRVASFPDAASGRA